jgi:hypothetical protein
MVASIRELNLLLISALMQLWFVTVVFKEYISINKQYSGSNRPIGLLIH